jgi:hypothetical protein
MLSKTWSLVILFVSTWEHGIWSCDFAYWRVYPRHHLGAWYYARIQAIKARYRESVDDRPMPNTKAEW